MGDRVNPRINSHRLDRLEERIIALEERLGDDHGPVGDHYHVRRGARGKWFIYFGAISTGERGYDDRATAEERAEELNETIKPMAEIDA